MGRNYSDQELTALRELIEENGHLYYTMGAQLEQAYTAKTGIKRSSGALYMVGWRLENGNYAHRGFAI